MHFASILFVAVAASPVFAAPASIALVGEGKIGNRAATTTCDDSKVALNTHDTNVAILSICGGIAGAIQKCGGNPTSTTGASGTSKFTLTPNNAGATLNVSKGRWERCVKAARAICPTGTFTSQCVGGTSNGDFQFVLSANK